jgi:hypothetical protein
VYKTAVKRRSVQWVLDVSTRPHNLAWLDYQEEIGLRHTPEENNRTDNRQTPPFGASALPVSVCPGVTPVHHFSESAVDDCTELDAIERAPGPKQSIFT